MTRIKQVKTIYFTIKLLILSLHEDFCILHNNQTSTNLEYRNDYKNKYWLFIYEANAIKLNIYNKLVHQNVFIMQPPQVQRNESLGNLLTILIKKTNPNQINLLESQSCADFLP